MTRSSVLRRHLPRLLCPLAFTALAAAQVGVQGVTSTAGEPRWRIVKPSNTGIPGELIHAVRHAPDGRLWVGARWPFWGEGGFGIYDASTEVWEHEVNWESGLPSEYVNDAEFEPDGTLWVATANGLARKDASGWRVWDTTNSPMQLANVRDIALAPDGHVWVNNSHFSGGGDAVYDFDGVSSWVRYAVPDQLPWQAPWSDLSSVFVDSRGHTWVANETLSGVAEFDGTGWTLRMANRGRLATMAEDQFGNLWIRGHSVGGDNAVFRWNGTSSVRYPVSTPTTLAADPENGTIYVGTWHGLVMRTLNGGDTFETYLSGLNRVVSIAPDPAGPDVWIGTAGAVGQFRDDGTWVRDFNTYNTGMPDYFVDYMSTDADGYFWMATGEGGLSRFDGRRWRNWGNHNAGAEPYPFAGNEPMGGAFQDSTGTHWFGGNGIARWDSATGQFSGFWNWQNNPGMGVTLFPFFAEDANGRLFAMSEYGAVFHFDPQSQLWVREPITAYGVTGVPGMQADSKGDVWIADWFDIHHWDGTSWSKVTLPDPSFFFDLGSVSAFAIGPDDVQWFGTNSGGLVRWDHATFQVYDSATVPLPSNQITGLDVRADGLIGLAAASGPSASGIATVDGDPASTASWTVHRYGASPLTHWQLTRVAFDARGALWVSALSEGAVVYDPDPHPRRRDPVRRP